MATRTAAEFDANGHEVLGAHGSASGHQVFITRAHQMPRLSWLRRERKRRREIRAGSRMIATATALLFVLGAGLLGVSLAAQYKYLFVQRHQHVPALIEAVSLDVGMLIFSLLALGLARAGKAARVERALILVCAVGSAGMNLAAANDGSLRSVAAYTMPPVFLAIVADRVISVVRRHFLDDDERSAWSVLGLSLVATGRAALYVLRFVAAPPSTVSGARRALLAATPLPELPGGQGRKAIEAPAEPQLIGRDPYDDLFDLWLIGREIERRPHEFAAGEDLPEGIGQCRYCCAVVHTVHDGSVTDHLTPWGVACEVLSPDDDHSDGAADQDDEPEREPLRPGETKTAAFLRVVTVTYGPLAGFPLVNVSRVAGELAPKVDLHPGTARRALKAAVVAATDEALGGVE
jgi:hypothetical protein